MSLEKKDVIVNLQAIIISCKGGLPLCNVQKDYLEAFGVKVPFQTLGYNSLREFFEKNSSDFYLVGDVVKAVEKPSMSHISSLVNRQKGKGKSSVGSKQSKSHRRPKKQESKNSLENFENTSNKKNKNEGSSRGNKEINEKHASSGGKENSREFRGMMNRFEKVTLRKPHTKQPNHSSSVGQSGDLQNLAKKDSTSFQSTTELKSITKTITNDRCSEFSTSNARRGEYDGFSNVQLFKNVEDLPIVNSAQSRLLRQKSKMLKDCKSSSVAGSELEKPANWNTGSQSASDLFFYLDSVNSPSPTPSLSTQSLPSPSHSIPTPQQSPPVSAVPLTASFPYQKAQARFANIKSSLQSTLIKNEINGNRTSTPEISSINSSRSTSSCRSEGGTSGNYNGEKYESEKFSSSGRSSADRTYLETSLQSSREIIVSSAQKSYFDYNCNISESSTVSDYMNKLVESSADTEYVKKLKELCRVKGLPEATYKFLVREPKNEPKCYICKVQIQDYFRLSSYPVETQDSNSAKEIAAKKMYSYLLSYDKCKVSPIVNEEEVLPRIVEIVCSAYGIWSDKLPILYKSRYQEELPEDWMNLVRKIPIFEIDHVNSTHFIIRKKANECDSVDVADLIHSLRQNQPKNKNSSKRKLPDLIFPDSEYWEVYITNINNSDEIWCRLIGDIYSDAYDAMMTKLELEPPERKVIKPKIGEIYGMKISAIWYRVELLELSHDNQGIVFYIDIGERENLDLSESELYEPDESFFAVAPQAIKFSLFELESFPDDEDLKNVLTSSLLGNTYIAEIITGSRQECDGKHDEKSVRLWDTSTDLDINVNQVLLNYLIKQITVPVLPSITQIKEVFVSCVHDNGDIYVQTSKKSVVHLKCIISSKIKTVGDKSKLSQKNDTIGTDILYLAKCKSNDTFCRAKITEIHNSSMVDVLFVDYGFIEKIAISELLILEKSSILQAIPPQALRVKLENLTNPSSRVISKLREMILSQDVLMKVVESNRGNVPLVEIFKRSQVGGILYSVNMKITNDPETKNSDSPTRRKSVVVGLEKVLPRNLPAPDLPQIGELFPVFVTLASSPDLFIVQPLASRMQLMDMMVELQSIFNNSESLPITLEEFIVGELYAVKHPDGNWYRGCAQAVVGSYTYSIYICDFGDCIMVTKEKLMHLPEKFKTFPYQAIRATLFGIPAECKDWTPIDCITFHKLVVEKYFISTVLEINRDSKNPNYVSLGLDLIDTSGDEDVFINKILIENKTDAFTLIKSSNKV